MAKQAIHIDSARQRDPRPWVPDAEMLSRLELGGPVPPSMEETVIIWRAPPTTWDYFSEILRGTAQPVELAFAGTWLEPRIEPYKSSLPLQGEGPMSFFIRNMEELGSCKELLDAMKKGIVEDGDTEETLLQHSRELSVDLYTGQEITEGDIRYDETPLASPVPGRTLKRMRQRHVFAEKRPGVGFGAGFNRNQDWAFSLGYKTDECKPPYDAVLANLYMAMPELSMVDGRRDVISEYGFNTKVLAIEIG